MAIENLPKDPMMLLSFVNTRLRDSQIVLSDFAAEFGVDQEAIKEKLLSLDYHYDETQNRFV